MCPDLEDLKNFNMLKINLSGTSLKIYNANKN